MGPSGWRQRSQSLAIQPGQWTRRLAAALRRSSLGLRIAAALSLLAFTIGMLTYALTGSPQSRQTKVELSGATVCSQQSAYVIGGQDPLNANLYLRDGCTGQLSQITSLNRFSAIASAGSRVAVAEASTDTDHISLLSGNRLTSLPNGDTPSGFTPDVNTAGDVIYTTLTNDPSRPFQVVVVNSHGARDIVARSANPLSFARFGPGGEVAVVEQPNQPGSLQPGSTSYLDVYRGHNLTRRIAIDVSNIDGFAWAWRASRFIVSSNSQPGAEYSTRDGRRLSDVPPGLRIEAVDQRTGTGLVVSGKRLFSVRITGGDWRQLSLLATPLPVYGAAWEG